MKTDHIHFKMSLKVRSHDGQTTDKFIFDISWSWRDSLKFHDNSGTVWSLSVRSQRNLSLSGFWWVKNGVKVKKSYFYLILIDQKSIENKISLTSYLKWLHCSGTICNTNGTIRQPFYVYILENTFRDRNALVLIVITRSRIPNIQKWKAFPDVINAVLLCSSNISYLNRKIRKSCLDQHLSVIWSSKKSNSLLFCLRFIRHLFVICPSFVHHVNAP